MSRKTEIDYEATAQNTFGCVELWAGNELAHRHLDLAGLEAEVIVLPSGSRVGGDLCALFSCGGQRVARIVVADCVGHGYSASGVADYVHKLVHQFRDIRDSSRFLAALNDEFTRAHQSSAVALRLTTVVAAMFDRESGEFSYAYAAHPRMMLWRAREARSWLLGEGMDGLPIGFIAGEAYTEASIQLHAGDIVLIFSDGVTDVFSPDGRFLGAEGLLELTNEMMMVLPPETPLQVIAEDLVDAIRRFHGSTALVDDLTLLVVRRP
jgi:phosphoserine phosphatase RsbU/P